MNFSIITCTYNPHQEIFTRLIKAVNALIIPENTEIEWIIVDNNSPHPIKELNYVNALISENNFTEIITEKEQGLTYARIAGVKKSKHDWIIFFDDDNEPQKDYVKNLIPTIAKFPNVACWGPGIINVEFIGEIKNKWAAEKKEIFQERNVQDTKTANTRGWTKYSPQGTGLCVAGNVLTEYLKQIEAGNFTMIDRAGKSLASGGDSQITLTAVKLGYYVGITNNLKLGHLITGDKANLKYLLRHAYGTHSGSIQLQNEVFPEQEIRFELPNNGKIIRIIYLTFRQHLFKIKFYDLLLNLYIRLGQANARFWASPKQKPIALLFFQRLINQ